MKKKINVIDLDKTLIPYDTFRLLIKKELYNLDLYVIKWTIIRIFRLVATDVFKFKITLYLEDKYDEIFFKSFAVEVLKDINKEVMELIENEVDGSTINILLSATPDLIVKHIINKLGWVGSGSYIETDGTFVHLFGIEKVNWLLRKYRPEKFDYNFTISDSASDDNLLTLFKKPRKWILP